MNHDKYKELIQLYVYDEISDSEKIDLENHLLECSDCSREMKSIKNLYNALASNRPVMVNEETLDDSRNLLLKKLLAAQIKQSLRDKILKYLEEFLFGGYKLALGGVATFAIGLLIGYFLLTNGAESQDSILTNQTINLDQLNKENVQISNIRFSDPVSSGDEIKFSFNITRPVSYSGDISDQFTQKLLATALLTADNPGVRIQSVNTISMQGVDGFIPDDKVKKTLITSLETDENPGVRRAAINTLMKFPLDQEIRDAFLFVLTHDNNAGIRVAAITGLSALKASGTSIDEKVKEVLRQNVENEDNNFVRIRAASLLEEVN